MSENHGIDIKYLRKLLLPVGIEFPKTTRVLNSLERLKNIRGIYAHSHKRKEDSISPEEALNIVYDVLEMVKIIKNKALNMSYYVL